MKYEGIRLDENEKLLRFLNFKAEYDPGGSPVWHEIYRSSCIPYCDTGIDNYFDYKYIFTTQREQNDWKLVSTTYFIGDLRFTVKNSSASNQHGGFCFIYYDEDSEKYCTKAFTEIDSKTYIYVNGINYLGKEFYEARTDYPNINTFYNIITNKSGFYDLCILTVDTDLDADQEYTEVEIVNQVSTLYDNDDYDFELCEYSNYPLYPDNFVFFEDINLKDKEWYDKYINHIRHDRMNEASNLLYNSGISSYNPRILNQIEQRLYQITEIESSGSEHAIGNKPHLVDYGTITNPQTGMNYVSNNTSSGFTVTVLQGTGIASVTGSGSYEAGDTVTLSATPSSGYTFDKWVTNDSGITIVNNQFTMPNRDVTVTATAILGPGLYETGTDNLIMSWEDLINDEDEHGDYKQPIIEYGEYYDADNCIISSSLTSELSGDLVTPSDLDGVGTGAFSSESGGEYLTNIQLPDSEVIIYDGAFSGSSITEFEANVKKLGYYAFVGCSELAEVTLRNLEEVLGGFASDVFGSDCPSLETVNLLITNPDPSLGGLLSPIPNLENINFLNGSTIVPANICNEYGSRNLPLNISLPNTITTIEDGAFYNCEIASINIPTSLTTIGSNDAYEGAFGSAVLPNNFSLPDLDYVGKYAFASSNIALINCAIEDIDENAFNDCLSLTSITLQNGTETIEDYAFYGCANLSSLTIPSTVTSIGSDAFYGADGDIVVNYGGTIAQWEALGYTFDSFSVIHCSNGDITP